MARVGFYVGALTVVFYFITPIFIITLILPVQLFRILVKFTKHFRSRKLGRIVSPLSNLFAIDKLYEKPTATLVLGSVYEGNLTKELVCQVITEKWLNKRDEKGSLCYPELRQGFTCWGGFTFWENDENFNVSNHVRTIPEEAGGFTRGTVRKLFVQLVNSPFLRKRSPWEIVIVPNYIGNNMDSNIPGTCLETLLLFKVHHSLVDGLSLLNLGRSLSDGDALSQHNVSGIKCGIISKIAALLKLPYIIVKFITGCASSQSVNNNKLRGSGNVTQFTFAKIQLPLVKRIKNKFEVTLSSVLMATYTAAIRHRLTQEKNCELPTSVSCTIPVPIEGHPQKLRNHMSFAKVSLPINETCSMKRLRILHKSISRARESLDTLCSFYLLKCIGSLPSPFVQLFVRLCPVPFLLTNFPGPDFPFSMDGHSCKEIFFNGGLLQGSLCTVFSCVGYRQTLNVAVASDEHVTKSAHEMDKLMKVMLKELEILDMCRTTDMKERISVA